jgi:hypothetical protein
MTDFITKAIAWIKANYIIAIIAALGIILIFFPKLLGGLFRKKRVKHRKGYIPVSRRRRTRPGRRSLPRSVGTHKSRPQYNKSGTRKKAWQIKGSLAARRHMAQIRRLR